MSSRPATARSIAAAVPIVPSQQSTSPASLTQLSTAAAVRCPVCAGTRLTRIAMVLTDGSPVDFTSCHTCEHRSWVQAGDKLGIDDVLIKARKER